MNKEFIDARILSRKFIQPIIISLLFIPNVMKYFGIIFSQVCGAL